MAYVGPELLRWALEQLRDWQAGVDKVRGRQTFPRFLVLKMLGVPADGTPSEPLTTGDFQRATGALFGIATAEEAGETPFGGVPHYLNPFTGSYQRGGGASDWAVGTLWTRSGDYAPISFMTVEPDEAAGASQARRFHFKDGYVSTILQGLGAKVPLVPLCFFLGRSPSPWFDETEANVGFADAQDVINVVAQQLGITAEEIDGAFQSGDAPDEPLSDSPMTGATMLAIALDVFSPTVSTTPQPVGGGAADQTVAAEGSAFEWAATFDGEDPCGLKGLGPIFTKAKAALAAGKHVVLYGPPGTGKSQLAECLCRTLGADFLLTTATSDWTTFDTIGGYFPMEGDSSALSFLPGIILGALKTGQWVIVDELNRADIDKAFGQLFSILAGQRVELPFLDRTITPSRRVSIGPAASAGEVGIEVPSNWRLIGTMNTFDKSSLFQLSYALMRRFAFVEVPAPDSNVLQEIMGAAIEGWPKDGREVIGEKMIHVFCAENGLRAAGREVGAAIPLDICRAIGMAADGNFTDADLVDLLDMYLLPQFEGLDRDHQKVFQALKETLELDEPTAAKLQRKLAGWTGFRQ